MADSANVTVVDKGGARTIVAYGELDLSNSQLLRDILKKSADREGEVILDLRPATFIDSAILAYIARAGGALADSDRCLKLLVNEGSQPLHVLKIVRFEELVNIIVEPPAQKGTEGCENVWP
jgi:anti-anti-sigma factor